MRHAAVLLLALASTTAHADRKSAEALAQQAHAEHDPVKATACGKEYLALYSAAPEDPAADELAYNAGVCFTEGKAIGAAIQAFDLVRRLHTKLDSRALERQAQLYAQILDLAQAAARLEEYAKRYAGEKEAPYALADAIVYRTALGDDREATADTELWIRMYGAKQPAEAARLAFARIGAAEQAKRDPVPVAEQYVRLFSAKGGAVRGAIAQERIASAKWAQACKGGDADGLCIVRPSRGSVAPGARCESPAVVIAISSRDAAIVRDATARFGRVVVELDRAVSRSALRDDLPVEAGQPSSERAALRIVDAQLEAELAKAPADRSSLAVDAWLSTRAPERAAIAAAYQRLSTDIKRPGAAVAALARIAMLAETEAGLVGGADVPERARKSASVTPRQTFCEARETAAAPLVVKAREAYDHCLAIAASLRIAGPFVDACERGRARLDPGAFALADARVPAYQVPLPAPRPEPAPVFAATAPADAREALAAFAAVERDAPGAAWVPAACRAAGGKIAAAAGKHADLAQLQYLAGLAADRCGKVDEARAAYAAVAASVPAARANLGGLAWRTGRAAAAKEAWTAAAAADGKLYGPHLGLAIVALTELRDLGAAPKGADARARAEEVRFQLASANAIDPEDPAAYGALAILRGPHDPLAAYAWSEALRLGDAPPWLAIAAGIDRDEPERIVAAAKAAPAWDLARFDAGLAKLRQRDYAGAAVDFAAIAAPSYDAFVARGLAALGQGDTAAAAAALQQAIAIDRARPDAHHDLALVHDRIAGSTVSVDARQKAVTAAAAERKAAGE